MGANIKQDLERLLTLPTVVGFGEIGLDYNRATPADKIGQMASFSTTFRNSRQNAQNCSHSW